MMMKHKFSGRVKTVMSAFAVVCLLAQCSPEEEIAPSIEVAEEVHNENLTAPVSSLTITGENTIVSDADVDCKTCTYVVMKNTLVVDGATLGLKAGSVICLDKSLNYGNLEFTNLVGTIDQPIVIGRTAFPSSH